MRPRVYLTLAALALGFCALNLRPASAQSLVGDQFSGALNFGGYSNQNFFNPTTATVVDPGVEFPYSDTFSFINVDLGVDTLLVQQGPVGSGGGANSWDIFLTDLNPATTLLSISLLSSTIPSLQVSLNNNTIQVSKPADTLPDTGYQALFKIGLRQPAGGGNTVPEPGALAMLFGAGVAGTGIVIRRKRA